MVARGARHDGFPRGVWRALRSVVARHFGGPVLQCAVLQSEPLFSVSGFAAADARKSFSELLSDSDPGFGDSVPAQSSDSLPSAMELRHPARDREIESGRGGVRRVKGNPPDRFARHKSTAALERTGVRASESAIRGRQHYRIGGRLDLSQPASAPRTEAVEGLVAARLLYLREVD